MKNQPKKSLLNRKAYKAIKKYDRQKMEGFFRNLCEQAFADGFKEGAKSSEGADKRIELVKFLENKDIKGVGEKTKEKLIGAYKEYLGRSRYGFY